MEDDYIEVKESKPGHTMGFTPEEAANLRRRVQVLQESIESELAKSAAARKSIAKNADVQVLTGENGRSR